MSKEGSPELTKSWVFVDPDKESSEDDKETKETSGAQEVTESEPHGDSESDSISVISESGCSYKTDEEEFSPVAVPSEKEDNTETEEKESELVAEEPEIIKDEPDVIEPKLPEPIEENKGIEKLLYFATSAVCAIVLIGLSVAVQQYLQGASDVNTFDPDQDFIYPHVQNVKTENLISESPKKYSYKRKNQFNVEELENKIPKLQEVKVNDKIISSVEDNDPKRERDVKANYKLSKNKSFKCNKENCDAKNYKHEKIRRDENNEKAPEPPATDETKRPKDETYDKKIKELRVKEDYLREKEKFLIEKEHDLMKKEIKLNKEKEHYEKNKHDKNPSFKKGKEDKKTYKKEESSEEESEERKDKFKPNKEYLKENFNTKNNKKYKYKEEKKEKEYPAHRRYKFSDDSDKKRNISGQWYMNLHEARDHMRQKKRASFKKNKAHWYFQWMVDRARLRVK